MNTNNLTLGVIDYSTWITNEHIETTIRVALLLSIGFPLIYLISRGLGKIFKKRTSEHIGLMVQKFVFLSGAIILTLTILYELGFNLTALLGAAGIASVAIGFASQTSLSNIISGLFLYWEKPFQVGDMIKVGDTLGIVLSIDLMSVKLRQPDNLFVRIPNETMIKVQVINITRFPIRRMDINIGVAYKEDVEKVIAALKEVAEQNPYSLDDPEPLILFKDYGESSLNFLLGLWFEKTQYLVLKNSIMQDIKKKFDQENIEFPFPHRTLYTRPDSEPFPIRIINSTPGSPSDST